MEQTKQMVELFMDLKLAVSVSVAPEKVEEVTGKIEMAVQQMLLTMITTDGEVLMPYIHDHSIENVAVLEED